MILTSAGYDTNMRVNDTNTLTVVYFGMFVLELSTVVHTVARLM